MTVLQANAGCAPQAIDAATANTTATAVLEALTTQNGYQSEPS